MKHAAAPDPPRRRANRWRGLGSWDVDRPPVLGAVGRSSGRTRLVVAPRAGEAQLVPAVRAAAAAGAAVDADEWSGYARLAWDGYGHATVCRAHKEWARDDDGDGVREVHRNTVEGIWTGLRNFPRPSRGVNKAYLAQYVATFLWSYNIKAVTDEFLRVVMGVKVHTICRT